MSDVDQKCLMLNYSTSDKMSDVSQNFSGTLKFHSTYDVRSPDFQTAM